MHTTEDSREDLEITQTGEHVDHSMCTEYYQSQREEIPPSGEGEAIHGSFTDQEVPPTGERSLSSVSSKYQTDKSHLIGRPWSTGWKRNLAQQQGEGEECKDGTLDLPPNI
ncbi:hypothetical protein TorRG33x02_157730 [Trema orientale]|uniref:Uncharacterized protein n=1 Tax=Trema orientale TaxID=63057 RepID=A0A2P5ES75_TREOI|nr:hypothetical protein TorRG33x02_157730 [Trema orientale]